MLEFGYQYFFIIISTINITITKIKLAFNIYEKCFKFRRDYLLLFD